MRDLKIDEWLLVYWPGPKFNVPCCAFSLGTSLLLLWSDFDQINKCREKERGRKGRKWTCVQRGHYLAKWELAVVGPNFNLASPWKNGQWKRVNKRRRGGKKFFPPPAAEQKPGECLLFFSPSLSLSFTRFFIFTLQVNQRGCGEREVKWCDAHTERKVK